MRVAVISIIVIAIIIITNYRHVITIIAIIVVITIFAIIIVILFINTTMPRKCLQKRSPQGLCLRILDPRGCVYKHSSPCSGGYGGGGAIPPHPLQECG